MFTYLFFFRLENIKAMSRRVIEVRKRLRDTLERLGTPGNWSHITSQIGMFSYTGLTGKYIFSILFIFKIVTVVIMTLILFLFQKIKFNI